ncbi:hypothetical protein IE81DRAFT_256966 [Ceraceosorus guamensis]|uniref:Zn(2)-C6 fungal-type domain-containing protein n=1 Tax=Ceraceosorus guamensis TaxID=1522189 RepID=A0A316VTP2_9BASI|nr:hypothetical protein IE81DRAFT_256966 [Ceraceosorus guamensis]PWN39813.1 hypothetical protein IE81DRAFT_256966 [Ceraceosorus guamensis]
MPRVPSHAASWQASRHEDVPSSAWSMTATALAAPHADASPHQKGSGTKGSSPRSSSHKSALNVNHDAARLDAALASADFEQVTQTRTPFMGEMFSDSSYDGFSDMLGQTFLQNAGSTAQQQQQLSHSGSSKDLATSSSASQQDAHRGSDTGPGPGSGDTWNFGVTNMHSSARTTPSHSRQASQDGTEDGEVAKGSSSTNTSTNARQSACPFCDRVFKRSDLALRHITRVHSSSTAHKCKHCDVGFSRSDVLKRHMTTCRKGPGGKSLKPMKKACESCASLKIVCDRQDPSCASCRDRDIQCIYKPSAKLVRTKSPVRVSSDEEIPMAKERCAPQHPSDGHFEDQHSSSSRQQHAPPSMQSPEASQPQPADPAVSHPPAAVSRSVHQSGMPAYDPALVMPGFADATGASAWNGPDQNIPMDVNGVPVTAALTMDLGQNAHLQDQAMQDWSSELHGPAAFAYATSGADMPPLLAPQQVAPDASLSMPMMDIIHSTGLTPYDVGIDAKMNQNSQAAPVASTSGSISEYPRTADIEQGQEQALHLSDVLLGTAPGSSSLASDTSTRGHNDGGNANLPFGGLAPSIEGVTGGSAEASLLGFLHHNDFFARVQSPLSDLLVAGTPSFLPPGADASRLTQPEHHIWPVMPSAK